jgi:glycosyltransferase involved in cell wall biosynthesis
MSGISSIVWHPDLEVMSRVLFVAPHFAEYTLRLAEAVARQHSVMLVVEQSRLRGAAEVAQMQCIQSRVDIRAIGFRLPGDLLRLVGWIIAFRPAVIHLQEASGSRKATVNLIVMLLFRAFGRVILTVHDPIPHSGRDCQVAARVARRRRIAQRLAHVVLVHGDHCRVALQSSAVVDPRRIRVTTHGVVMVPTEQVRQMGNRGSFLLFGRMEKYKGLEVLLDAARILKARGCDFRLEIMGTGSEMDRLEAVFLREGLALTINAFVDVAQIIDGVQRASVVVLPYLDATQSGVLAGAFAGWRPVIASRVGGLVDVVVDGQNGLLVTPGDPVGLADAMQRLIADPPLLAHLTQGARAAALGSLDWGRIADALADCYQT